MKPNNNVSTSMLLVKESTVKKTRRYAKKEQKHLENKLSKAPAKKQVLKKPAKPVNKRKKTPRKVAKKIGRVKLEKRQKISDDPNQNSSEKAIKQSKIATKAVRARKGAGLTNSKTLSNLRSAKAAAKKKEERDLEAENRQFSDSTSHNSTAIITSQVRIASKNPYYSLIDTLPKEIQGKIDWTQESLEGMFKTLTPPNEQKP